VVFLLMEPRAAEAVVTAVAIFAEGAVGTVLTVLGVVAVVTLLAIHALRAPLTLHAERDAIAARALSGIPCVVDVLAVEDAETVVAVL